MADSTNGPLLTVQTATASTFGHVQNCPFPYTGADGVDYVIALAYLTNATTDTLHVFTEDKTVAAGYAFTAVVTGLTKYKRYSFTLHMDRVYYTNGTDAIGWIYIDDSGTITSGTLANAPLASYIISSKGALWLGGTTVLNYTTGTAVFTNASKTVTGTGTKFTENLRAGDKIGTSATPSVYYIIDRIDSDLSLQLTVAYVAATSANTAYKSTRTSVRHVYWSAEEAMNDFTRAGIDTDPEVGGFFTSGVLQLNAPNTGLHEYNDAVLMFTQAKGYYVQGINPSDWTIPRSLRLPVGCISHWSITSKDDFLGFLSSKGYYVTKGGQLSFQDLSAQSFSEVITPQITDIDKEVAHLVEAYVYKDSLFIAVPSTETYSETDSELSYSTGTVSISDAATAVTGVSSLWRGTIMVNDQIRFDGEVGTDGNPLYYNITAIGSDTTITVDRAKDGTVSAVAYVIRKRRQNRILVLDTRTNVRKASFGWTIYNNVNPDGFVLYKNQLFYGSSTSGYVYTYDTGGTLYGADFIAAATTGRWNCGYPLRKKYFKMLKISAKGTGTVYVTPYVDGVAKTQISHIFTDSTQFQTITFPRASNGFSSIGHEIYFVIQLTASDETIEVKLPQVGFQLQPLG